MIELSGWWEKSDPLNPGDIAKLRALVAYLRDELDWPIEVEDADDITIDCI